MKLTFPVHLQYIPVPRRVTDLNYLLINIGPCGSIDKIPIGL